MAYCEMCGRDSKRIVSVDIEGAVLKVCPECARFGHEVKAHVSGGKVVATTGVDPEKKRMLERVLERRRRIARGRDVFEEISEYGLVDDYPLRVRRAREKLGLTREDLARKINEKESVISRVESGHILPDRHLVRKLEKALHIRLRGKVTRSNAEYKTGKYDDGGLTLGDLINLESK